MVHILLKPGLENFEHYFASLLLFYNYHTVAVMSHSSKIKDRNGMDLPDVQAVFRKGRRTRDQIANIYWIIKKARAFQKKTSISALLTMPKPLKLWKILKECEYKIITLAS